jgi:hypothetical protein
MNYEEKIQELLKSNMTEKGFKLWVALNDFAPSVWEKSTSSSGKYHHKEGGRIPSIGEHVWEMLYACMKLLKIFSVEARTTSADTLLLAIVLHDVFKYGTNGNLGHTDNSHDKVVGDVIHRSKGLFLKHLSEEQFCILEEATRFHSGQWSTNASDNFTFKGLNPETSFVHMLDMLSTANLIKTSNENFK